MKVNVDGVIIFSTVEKVEAVCIVLVIIAFFSYMYYSNSVYKEIDPSIFKDESLTEFNKSPNPFDRYDGEIMFGDDILGIFNDFQGKPYAIIVRNSDFTTEELGVNDISYGVLGVNFNALVTDNSSNCKPSDGLSLESSDGNCIVRKGVRINGEYNTIKDYVKPLSMYKAKVVNDSSGRDIGIAFNEYVK